MKHRTLAVAILALTAAFGAAAQNQNNSLIEYSPVLCFRGGDLPLLQMNIETKGELRAYFRRINTTDWCSVQGTNEGPLSRVVMPKFDNGDEVEYFLVVIHGRRVVSRSPRIYRASVDNECKATVARNVLKISLSCGDEMAAIPTSMGAGYSVTTLGVLPPEVGDPGDRGGPGDPGPPPPPVGAAPESPFDPNQRRPPQ